MNIIFDLDGTLLDSSNAILRVWKTILIEENIPINKREIEQLLGLTNQDIIEWFHANKQLPEDKALRILQKCQQEENCYLKKNGGTLFPQVKETLHELAQVHALYIVSNCQSGYIEAFLTFYGISNLFKDFECSGNTKKNKAQNIKLILERNKIRHAVYVGDTASDYDAATANRLPFVFAGYGFGAVANPAYRIDCFDELIGLINTLEKKGDA